MWDCPNIYHLYLCMLCCNGEKKLSNLFSRGIISNISCYGNTSHGNVDFCETVKVVILLLLIVLDKIVTIFHMSGLFTPNHRVLSESRNLGNVTRVTTALTAECSVLIGRLTVQFEWAFEKWNAPLLLPIILLISCFLLEYVLIHYDDLSTESIEAIKNNYIKNQKQWMNRWTLQVFSYPNPMDSCKAQARRQCVFGSPNYVLMVHSTGALDLGWRQKCRKLIFSGYISGLPATDWKFDESQKSPLRVLHNLHIN